MSGLQISLKNGECSIYENAKVKPNTQQFERFHRCRLHSNDYALYREWIISPRARRTKSIEPLIFPILGNFLREISLIGRFPWFTSSEIAGLWGKGQPGEALRSFTSLEFTTSHGTLCFLSSSLFRLCESNAFLSEHFHFSFLFSFLESSCEFDDKSRETKHNVVPRSHLSRWIRGYRQAGKFQSKSYFSNNHAVGYGNF